MRARCDDCRRVWDADELNEPKDLMQRLDPGGVVPAGQCPTCGALAYPLIERADAEAYSEDETRTQGNLILVVGTPADGLTFYGPYESGDDVNAEHRDLRNNYWWIVELHPPIEHEEESTS